MLRNASRVYIKRRNEKGSEMVNRRSKVLLFGRRIADISAVICFMSFVVGGSLNSLGLINFSEWPASLVFFMTCSYGILFVYFVHFFVVIEVSRSAKIFLVPLLLLVDVIFLNFAYRLAT